jgi:hypothetical protein
MLKIINDRKITNDNTKQTKAIFKKYRINFGHFLNLMIIELTLKEKIINKTPAKLTRKLKKSNLPQ